MKNLFPGYYPLTDDEIKKLWESSIFVFDTNVLLNLYRYSHETSNEILKILTMFSERIWITHQTAKEFLNNRSDIINKQQESYKKLQDSVNKELDKIIESLASKRHPFIQDHSEIVNKINSLKSDINKSLEGGKINCTSLDKDVVFEKVTDLFTNKTGKPYSEERLATIYKDGEKRYQKKIPPGFEDDRKDDNKYGDYVMWLQMIDHSQSVKKSIIFITEDKKQDWWSKDGSKTISPHPLLINEFREKTGLGYHMYELDRFIEFASEQLKFKTPKNAINEIKDIAKMKLEFNKLKYDPSLMRIVNEFELNQKNNIWRDTLEYELKNIISSNDYYSLMHRTFDEYNNAQLPAYREWLKNRTSINDDLPDVLKHMRSKKDNDNEDKD